MLKLTIVIVSIVIAYVAYTGIDVTSEYQAISDTRSQVFENVIDPIAKKVLKQASESDFDVFVESTISKYGEKNE